MERFGTFEEMMETTLDAKISRAGEDSSFVYGGEELGGRHSGLFPGSGLRSDLYTDFHVLS